MKRWWTPVWRLTSWYVLIIMVISVMFSTIIYQLTINQVRQSLPGRVRFETDFAPRFNLPLDQHIADYFEQQYDLIVTSVRLRLLILNLSVLAVSSVASYYLAKRTLRPIEQSLDDQRHFTADASHELRTPLAAMKAEIEVAMKEKNMAEHHRVLQSNLEEVNKLERLATSLLHLARHDVSGHAVVMEPVEVAVIVTEAIDRIRPMAKQKSITLVHDHIEGRVMGDQTKLTELLVILLDNAVKYSHDGGQVSLTAQSTGKQVILKVVDSGIGISAEDMPHVFNRFYRADQSRSSSGVTGFGLGLAIAKQIVDRHHGQIHLTSELGHGTTVTVTLAKA
jgi:signal transduction histidine kinase